VPAGKGIAGERFPLIFSIVSVRGTTGIVVVVVVVVVDVVVVVVVVVGAGVGGMVGASVVGGRVVVVVEVVVVVVVADVEVVVLDVLDVVGVDVVDVLVEEVVSVAVVSGAVEIGGVRSSVVAADVTVIETIDDSFALLFDFVVLVALAIFVVVDRTTVVGAAVGVGVVG
jgi:hypothetical protein